MFLESWHYHPLGLLILGLFVFTAAQSLFPKACRDGLVKKLQTRARIMNLVYLGFVTVFVGFGVVRALLHYRNALEHFGLPTG